MGEEWNYENLWIAYYLKKNDKQSKLHHSYHLKSTLFNIQSINQSIW